MESVANGPGNSLPGSQAGSAVRVRSRVAVETCTEDWTLIAALQSRDESAFTALVQRYYTPLLRLAMLYVPSHAVAEEVVQETWLGVLRGIDRFEGRSSLKTWLFTILTNRAKTRGVREGRSVPFSALWNPENDPSEPAVEPERFLDASHPQWPGHWS